ncbi:hypothetical protein FB388_7083 [Pseudonocardia cypriaca]|uniref:Uncharacterized protein n=2 Tax=Pseudonocardia cypriaca TaxID=882449 RepID=A0A543FPJ9_9PSEU|nr:hypothetical protein FB388_7083 [Pseudonocardia cypriaca]
MGPLPAAVYWRRRWVAVGSMVAVIVAMTWGIAALTSTPDEPETARRTTSRAAVSAPQETSPPPAAPPYAALLPATLPSAAQPTGAPQPGAAGSVPPTASIPEPLVVDDAPPTTAPPPTTTPPPTTPARPVPCTNDMIAVGAEVVGPERRVGERMVLRLVVTNSSTQPCVRDLDPVRQEIVVWSADGSQRLWSSNDCSSAKGADPRTLAPGQPLTFTVRWAGRTSAPGCPQRRDTVPAGEYRLLTRVDDVISPPTQFVREP